MYFSFLLLCLHMALVLYEYGNSGRQYKTFIHLNKRDRSKFKALFKA